VVYQRSGLLLRIWRGQVATGIDRYEGKPAGKILILAGVLNMLNTCYIHEKTVDFCGFSKCLPIYTPLYVPFGFFCLVLCSRSDPL